MPRKQRFKPSRKQPSSQQLQPPPDKQPEIHPDDVDIESDVPARGRTAESDVERNI